MDKSALLIISIMLIAALVLLSGCVIPNGGGGDNNGTARGKCGDGVCGPVEKQKGICQQDCRNGQPDQNISPREKEKAAISVDFSSGNERIGDYLFGTIAGPKFDEKAFPLLQEADFRLVEIKVNIAMPENPSDVSSYDFSQMDSQINSTISIGAVPIIWFAQESKPDLDNYKAYVKTIVSHAKGLSQDVKLFRFGNEPDGGKYWKGTEQDYFETYAAFAEAAKSVDNSNILIAPSVTRACEADCSSILDFVQNFLDYLKENNVNLDYFTFHAYSYVPYSRFYLQPSKMSELLKNYPVSNVYGTPRLGNDEWNLMVGDAWSGNYNSVFDTAEVAASNINSLISMANAGVSLSVRYGGASNGEGHDFPLTDKDYKGKPSFYAFKGFNMLYGHYLLDSTGGDNFNLGVIAGKSDDDLIIIISNFDIEDYINRHQPRKRDEYEKYSSQIKAYNGYALTITGIPWAGSLAFERYLVDDSHNLGLVESKTINAAATLAFEYSMPAPSLQIIKISRQA